MYAARSMFCQASYEYSKQREVPLLTSWLSDLLSSSLAFQLAFNLACFQARCQAPFQARSLASSLSSSLSSRSKCSHLDCAPHHPIALPSKPRYPVLALSPPIPALLPLTQLKPNPRLTHSHTTLQRLSLIHKLRYHPHARYAYILDIRTALSRQRRCIPRSGEEAMGEDETKSYDGSRRNGLRWE